MHVCMCVCMCTYVYLTSGMCKFTFDVGIMLVVTVLLMGDQNKCRWSVVLLESNEN